MFFSLGGGEVPPLLWGYLLPLLCRPYSIFSCLFFFNSKSQVLLSAPVKSFQVKQVTDLHVFFACIFLLLEQIFFGYGRFFLIYRLCLFQSLWGRKSSLVRILSDYCSLLSCLNTGMPIGIYFSVIYLNIICPRFAATFFTCCFY